MPFRPHTITAVLALSFFSTATIAADAFPLPQPSESFDAGTLRVDKFGTGPKSLILIPGLACGPWVWSGTIAKFAPTYTLYVVTLPGFDGRAATDKTPLFATVTADIWTLIAARKLAAPIVVGHSLGGTLAIALAAEHPDRLSAIVNLDGLPVFPPLADASPKQREDAASQAANFFAAMLPADLPAQEKKYMSTVGTNRPDLVDPAAALEARSDPKALAAWIKEVISTDLRPSLPKITIPFLELMPYEPADAKRPGNYTQELTLAFYKSLVAAAPKSSVVPITPSRHFLMLDQPDAFYTALETFLTSLDR